MLVYVAPQCRKNANQCHQAEVLDRLVQRLEGSKGYERFLGLFEPLPPY